MVVQDSLNTTTLEAVTDVTAITYGYATLAEIVTSDITLFDAGTRFAFRPSGETGTAPALNIEVRQPTSSQRRPRLRLRVHSSNEHNGCAALDCALVRSARPTRRRSWSGLRTMSQRPRRVDGASAPMAAGCPRLRKA